MKLCLVCNLYFMLIGISLISLKLGREIKLKGNVPDLIAQSVVSQSCMCARARSFSLKIPDVIFSELSSWIIIFFF